MRGPVVYRQTALPANSVAIYCGNGTMKTSGAELCVLEMQKLRPIPYPGYALSALPRRLNHSRDVQLGTCEWISRCQSVGRIYGGFPCFDVLALLAPTLVGAFVIHPHTQIATTFTAFPGPRSRGRRRQIGIGGTERGIAVRR